MEKECRKGVQREFIDTVRQGENIPRIRKMKTVDGRQRMSQTPNGIVERSITRASQSVRGGGNCS